MPVIQNFANSAKEEEIKVGSNILNDLAQGKDIQESVKIQGRKALNNMTEKLKQCGKGRRRYKEQLSFY